MITPGLEEQENKHGSRYELVLLAAQRAKQIQEGAAPLVRTDATHPLSIALEEIRAGAYPPLPKESTVPKSLDEAFIGQALAEQDLTDIDSRFGAGTPRVAPETELFAVTAPEDASADDDAEG